MICLKHWVFHDQESPKRHFFAQSLVLRPPKRKFGKCSQPCGSSGCLNSTILSANEGEIKEWGKIPMHLYITKYSPDWASLDVIVFARHSALHKDSRFHVIPHGCKLSASGMSKTGGQNIYSYRIYSYYRCKSATVWKLSEVTALRPSKLWKKKVCKLFLGSPWWRVPKYLHWTQKKKASRVLLPRHSKEFAPRNSSRRFSARLKGGFPVTPSIADNKPVGSIKGILGVGEDSHRLQVEGKIIVPKKMQAKLKVMPPHGTFTPSMSTTNLRG